MKRFFVLRRCILIKTFQHSESAPFPLSFFQTPHRRSTWQMAYTTSSRAALPWILGTIVEQMDSACPPLIVRHVYFDQVVKVPFTLIKVILFCHLIWMRVKQLRNHTSPRLNEHLL